METILSTLPSVRETERVVVVMVQKPGQGSHLELRQQSFGEGIGWFTQTSVQLEPGQVADLRGVIGSTSAPLPKSYRRPQSASWQPKIVQAETA